MACALACAPLVDLRPAFTCPSLHVKTYLDTPLVAYADPRELLLLAAMVDAAAERTEKVRGAQFSQGERLQRLEALCRSMRPELKPAETLHDLGLMDYFPALGRRLTGQSLAPSPAPSSYYGTPTAAAAATAATAAAAVHLGVQYLTYISLLNQVVMMGTQLYHDASLPAHHKYAAHQVALLYQSLNMLQGDTKPIRRVIEGRFDEIKAITESGRPHMTSEMCTWLQRVTWVCREEINMWPSYSWRRVSPVVALYRGQKRPAGC